MPYKNESGLSMCKNISTPCINSNNSLAVNCRAGFVVKKTKQKWILDEIWSSQCSSGWSMWVLFCFITPPKKCPQSCNSRLFQRFDTLESFWESSEHSSFFHPSHMAYCLTWDLKGKLPCGLNKNRITERRWTVKTCGELTAYVCVRARANMCKDSCIPPSAINEVSIYLS